MSRRRVKDLGSGFLSVLYLTCMPHRIYRIRMQVNCHKPDGHTRTAGQDLACFVDDVLIVLVLYKCQVQHSLALTSIADGVAQYNLVVDLVIYDNSPELDAEPSATGHRGIRLVKYIHDPSNPGVSRAYNTAARLARQLNKKWLLLADQDTNFPHDLLEAFSRAHSEYPDAGILSCPLKSGELFLSPCVFRFGRGKALKVIRPGLLLLKHRSVLNSGLCIQLDDFSRIGKYNERISLDFSDHEFISRAGEKGVRVAIIDAHAEHRLSSIKQSKSAALSRFAYYCIGARETAAVRGDIISISILVAARTVLLICRHKTLAFGKIFAANYMRARHD